MTAEVATGMGLEMAMDTSIGVGMGIRLGVDTGYKLRVKQEMEKEENIED